MHVVSFSPRQRNCISPYLPAVEITSLINKYSSSITPLILTDLTALVPFHSQQTIASLIRAITALEIIITCSHTSLFSQMQTLFSQCIQESPTHFSIYSTKTKKAHVIPKIQKNNEILKMLIDVEERDIMTLKQKENKETTALPFEKTDVLLRFGDDSDASSNFSDDDDLDL